VEPKYSRLVLKIDNDHFFGNASMSFDVGQFLVVAPSVVIFWSNSSALKGRFIKAQGSALGTAPFQGSHINLGRCPRL